MEGLTGPTTRGGGGARDERQGDNPHRRAGGRHGGMDERERACEAARPAVLVPPIQSEEYGLLGVGRATLPAHRRFVRPLRIGQARLIPRNDPALRREEQTPELHSLSRYPFTYFASTKKKK